MTVATRQATYQEWPIPCSFVTGLQKFILCRPGDSRREIDAMNQCSYVCIEETFASLGRRWSARTRLRSALLSSDRSDGCSEDLCRVALGLTPAGGGPSLLQKGAAARLAHLFQELRIIKRRRPLDRNPTTSFCQGLLTSNYGETIALRPVMQRPSTVVGTMGTVGT
jgi:hypothetical protein